MCIRDRFLGDLLSGFYIKWEGGVMIMIFTYTKFKITRFNPSCTVMFVTKIQSVNIIYRLCSIYRDTPLDLHLRDSHVNFVCINLQLVCTRHLINVKKSVSVIDSKRKNYKRCVYYHREDIKTLIFIRFCQTSQI